MYFPLFFFSLTYTRTITCTSKTLSITSFPSPPSPTPCISKTLYIWEIPVINRLIPDFEAIEFPSVQNPISPSLLSYFLSFSTARTYFIFFKWGDLVLVPVASFTTLVKSIEVLITSQFHPHHPFSPPLLTEEDDYSDSSFDSDSDIDDSTTSFSYSEQDDRGDGTTDEDNSVEGPWQNGNFNLRRRRKGSVLDFSSWSSYGTT